MTIRELAENIDIVFNRVQGVSVADIELILKRAFNRGDMEAHPVVVAHEIGDLLKLSSYWRHNIYGLILRSEINS